VLTVGTISDSVIVRMGFVDCIPSDYASLIGATRANSVSWVRHHPSNVIHLYHAADYGARELLTYLNMKLFVRLIRPTMLFHSKVIKILTTRQDKPTSHT
jgi:hypothetical protein